MSEDSIPKKYTHTGNPEMPLYSAEWHYIVSSPTAGQLYITGSGLMRCAFATGQVITPSGEWIQQGYQRLSGFEAVFSAWKPYPLLPEGEAE